MKLFTSFDLLSFSKKGEKISETITLENPRVPRDHVLDLLLPFLSRKAEIEGSGEEDSIKFQVQPLKLFLAPLLSC
jgi:hypothetical protein